MKKPDNFSHYNKSLKPLARNNRYNMTKAEACLWKYALRAKQMCGYSFNRQRAICQYIVDFYCKSLKLVIEVDGISHFDDEVKEKDSQKQTDLEQLGYTVLRFSDGEVLNEINRVKYVIEQSIKQIEQKQPPS